MEKPEEGIVSVQKLEHPTGIKQKMGRSEDLKRAYTWAVELRCLEQPFRWRNTGLKGQHGARPLRVASYQQVKLEEAKRKREEKKPSTQLLYE